MVSHTVPYKLSKLFPGFIPCGGGIEYSAVALRVEKGDGKGTQYPGVYVGHPIPGGYKYGDLALQVGGVSRIGTIIYGLNLLRTGYFNPLPLVDGFKSPRGI
jgi:hypothetical protein